MRMPTPTLDPGDRPQTGIEAADHYPIGAPVWVHRGGRWRPGCVLESSPRAAMVRYRPTDERGTAVDTVTAVNLLDRTDVDQIDQPPAWPDGMTVRPRGAEHDTAVQPRERAAAGCLR